jgi:predicted Zn-dependent peptidase
VTGPDRSALPVPGPEPAFTFPGAERTRLGNGLSVWSLERGSVPLVSIIATLPLGSWADPDGKAGLASLTADMLDEGAGGRTAIEIQEAIARLGGEMGIDAGHDAVTVSVTLLQRHLAEGLQLLADIVCRPDLSERDVERVRTLRLNRLRQLRDVPAALAERVFAETLYGTHPYAHLPFGATASIEGLTRADLHGFHAAAYRPDRTTLIVAGPASAHEVRDAVEGAFGGWTRPGGDADGQAPAVVAPAPSAHRLVLVDRPGAAQTELRVGHVAQPRSTPDYHALLVLNAVLGGQFVSRINLNLRERRGYTYGARTAFEFRRHAGPFSLATSVQTDATAHAVEESLAEMAAIRGERPVTASEAAMAQQTLTLGYPRNFESTDQVARALLQLVLHGLPDDTFASFSPRVRALDTATITAAAHRHLDPDRMAVVAVGDVARIGEGLRGLGLGEPRIAAPAL